MKAFLNWDELPVADGQEAPLTIEAGRSCYWEFKLWKPNGRAAAIALTAVVRFKLSQQAGDDPLLDIDSLGSLAGGSIIVVQSRGVDETTPAQVKVCFAQDDTADLEPGEYCGEIGVVDAAETNPLNAFKRAGYGTVIVRAAPGGDVGLT